ncbi:mRNA-binding protein [Martiniozyma asiatica (nom. inval.)]|nr:mRNA-binding protein [Martiniozyma asiatica]
MSESALRQMDMEDRLSKVRSQLSSKLDNQKQHALALSTIEESLPESPSAVAYFVAFFTLLNQSCENDQITNIQMATSALYLLDIVAPYTPKKLLKEKFSDILVMLAPALSGDADAPLIRSSIGVLESLLIAQDTSAWKNVKNFKISPKRALTVLLDLSLDPRPKVRKRGQEAIKAILSKPPIADKEHPAGAYCGEVSLNGLIKLIQENKPKKNNKESNSLLIHNLQLVGSVTNSNSWPLRQITPLCDVLLEICKSADQFLVSSVFNAFEGLFQSMTTSTNKDKFTQVLDIIFNLKPAINDPHLAPSWLAVIAKGLTAFAKIDPIECLEKLPQVFTIVSNYFSSDSLSICESASQCLIAITVDSIDDSLLLLPPSVTNEIYEKMDEIINQLSKISFDFLSVKYRHAAQFICELIATMMTKFRSRANPDMLQHLKLIGDWRSHEKEGFELNTVSEKVIASAIASLGPEVVLDTLPLNLTNSQKTGRAWLLPILRDNVQMAHLKYYWNNILPIVEFFNEKISHTGSESMNRKIFETIVDQIWSILPYFCFLPVDLQDAFTDDLGAKLASGLYENPNLRPVICNALKNLVITLQERISQESNDVILNEQFPIEKAQNDLKFLAETKAANLLSVLFNVFTQTPIAHRSFVSETIDSYLSISTVDDLIATFDKVCSLLRQALDEEKEEDKIKYDEPVSKSKIPKLSITMMDLIVLITKHIPQSSHIALLTIFNETVRINDVQIQKRSYRIINNLLQSTIGKETILNYFDNLLNLLVETSDLTLPAAKSQRMETILALLNILPSSHIHFIPAILSEVILSTKSSNEKTRTTSYAVIISMGSKMNEFKGQIIRNSLNDSEMADSQASIEEFFTMCSAGLVGSTGHMISAAVTALSCIFYEFGKELDISIQKELLENVLLFFSSKNREIIKPVIGFVKVAIMSMPEDEIKPLMKGLLAELMIVNNEQKNHFKSKIKHLVERLVRKFGLEFIESNMPEDDRKLIVAIRKAKNKKANVNSTDSNDADHVKSISSNSLSALEQVLEDSDSEDEDENIVMGKGKQGKAQQFITEGDIPLDLLSKDTLSHISTRKFGKKQMDKVKNETKTKNGKLVFNEDNDDPLAGKDALDAYVEAIKQGPVRDARNRLKWKNNKDADINWDDDETDNKDAAKKGVKKFNKGKGGINKPKQKFKARKKL